jgi:hypothetical protein
LRFDVNGLQMGAVATRITHTLSMNPNTDPAVIADLQQKKKCQLCGQHDADSRYHLLVKCPALETHRSNLDLDFTIQSQERRKPGSGGTPLRISLLKCNRDTSLQSFLLGELNCLLAVVQSSYSPQERSIFFPSSQNVLPLSHVQASSQVLDSNQQPGLPPRRCYAPDVREKIIRSTCGCSYPLLSIKTRLRASADFIQQLYKSRFSGTSLAVSDSSTEVYGQIQTITASACA